MPSDLDPLDGGMLDPYAPTLTRADLARALFGDVGARLLGNSSKLRAALAGLERAGVVRVVWVTRGSRFFRWRGRRLRKRERPPRRFRIVQLDGEVTRNPYLRRRWIESC